MQPIKALALDLSSLPEVEMLKVKAEAGKFVLPLNAEQLAKSDLPLIVKNNPNIGTEEQPRYEFHSYRGAEHPLSPPLFVFHNPVDSVQQVVSLAGDATPILIVNDIHETDALQLKQIVADISQRFRNPYPNWGAQEVAEFLIKASICMTSPQYDESGQPVRKAQKFDCYDSTAEKLQSGKLGFSAIDVQRGQGELPFGHFKGTGNREALLVQFPKRGAFSLVDRREKLLGCDPLDGQRYMAVVKVPDGTLRAIQLDEFVRTHTQADGSSFANVRAAISVLPVIPYIALKPWTP